MQAVKDLPKELDVCIEKLSNLGYGIAKHNGFVIFVTDVAPGDKVRIRIVKKNKNFAHAIVLELLSPSPYRVKPFCPLQKVCGACQLQFIDYNYQLKLKKDIVADAVRSICGAEIEIRDVIPSPKQIQYRHKIQYPVSETKSSIRAGYYKTGTHELVNIKYCPIQPTYCDEIIEFIRQNAKKCGISGYNETEHSGLLRHIVIRTSSLNQKSLVILVVNAEGVRAEFIELARKIYTEIDNIAGVGINYNVRKTNLILGEKTEILEGDGFIEEKLCDRVFKVGAKTFFQVNPYTADNIFRYVKEYISNHSQNSVLLDAYAGITAFGICMADVAKKVVSVEEVKESVALADVIVRENKIKNVELHNKDAAEFFESELKKRKKGYDITILDPPRKGCTEKSLDYALQLTKEKIIYVSCNPATLARDLKYLIAQGCRVEFIQPFDMFPHTYHVESVAVINL